MFKGTLDYNLLRFRGDKMKDVLKKNKLAQLEDIVFELKMQRITMSEDLKLIDDKILRTEEAKKRIEAL